MALTNEELNKRFSNPFELVTYAIDRAKSDVSRGEGMRSHLATEILAKIAKTEEPKEKE